MTKQRDGLTMPRCLPMTGCLLLLCLLLGCTGPNTGPDSLAEYLARLERVTGVSIPERQPFNRAYDLPRAQQASRSASNQIDLIDFLSLSGCELQINLGRRNTQLGRTASPSQRLLLDLEFMRLAPACSALLRERDNMELAKTLDIASHERQQHLANSISDAILMGPEWEAFWERPKVLAHYPDDTSSRLTAVLGQLAALSAQWLAGDWAASNREFELLLSELRAGDGGALILAYSVASRDIARATQMLLIMSQTAPLCPYGQPTKRSRIFENIVSRFFVGDVQPWLVALRRRKEVLMTPVETLEQPLLSSLSPRYVQWTHQRAQLLSRQTNLIKTHIEAIQTALTGCASG